MTNQPSPNGPNGRDDRGRFASGNPGGPGNPHACQVGRLRTALLAAVSEDDMTSIVAKLVAMAKAGDVRAIKEVFDRTLGRPVEADLLERLATLEAVAEQKGLLK